LTSGTILAHRYRVEELIGSGGYASVYRATDLTLGNERAIKEVVVSDPGVRAQFRLEADLLINSSHPNIPRGYQAFEELNHLFLVMDYVRGKDAEELLNDSLVHRARPLDEEQVLRWAMDICGALEAMHSQTIPIIHRDIKPANIKITPEDVPVLIDFGIAKLRESDKSTMTAAQGVSPGFAPPEQYMAKGRTDARTDIYGLGATLYACLTGKDPPEAPARLLAQTGAAQGGSALRSPRLLNLRISEETDRIIVTALELSPIHRQQSAHQLRDELFAALQQLSTGVDQCAVIATGGDVGILGMPNDLQQGAGADEPRDAGLLPTSPLAYVTAAKLAAPESAEARDVGETQPVAEVDQSATRPVQPANTIADRDTLPINRRVLRVFVSHSHADLDYCREFVDELRLRGVDAWFDEYDLGVGQLRRTIDQQLQSRPHFVAILSPAAVNSDWVNREIDGALDLMRESVVVTFALVVAVRSVISPTLRGFKRIESADGTPLTAKEAAERLCQSLRPYT
jgi:serine/threonine-protein kinase